MIFLWSDAWLLQAIVLAAADGPATLSHVLGAADAVNHALPTDDELHGALSRLTGAGLVEEVEERFRPTDRIPHEVVGTIVGTGWQRGREAASTFLDAETWTPGKNIGDPRNKVTYRGLTAERILAADREYRARRR